MSRAGTGGPMVAGAAFAIAWTPCIGPTLGAILTAASLSTSAAHGALLLAVYSAGLGIPFLATALAFSRMTRLSNEHGGGVGRAQSLPRDQPQHLALRVAQLRKGSGDLAALRQDVGWIAAEIDPCGGQAIEQPGPSLRRAPTIGDHSVADAEQPWERRLRHLIATSPRDRESLSEDIIGSAEILNSPNHIDEFGHAVGDQALARLASVLRERVRSTDVVGRLGGDELTVLMPHADEEQAATLAVALLEKVRRECTVTASGRSMPITVSIGIGHFGHGLGLDPEQALRSADLAMYEAKEAGRDRVRVNRSTLGAAASWDTGSPPPPGSGGDRAPSSASPRA